MKRMIIAGLAVLLLGSLTIGMSWVPFGDTSPLPSCSDVWRTLTSQAKTYQNPAAMFPGCLGKDFHYGIQKAWGAEIIIPPPFDAAKRYAMKSPPDEDGDYLLKFEINEDETLTRIVFLYSPKGE